MIGFYPGIYWQVCWKFAAPLFLLFIIVYGLMGYEPLTYEGYVYPTWANVLGWLIAMSSVACIPGMAIYKLIVTPGTFLEVSFTNYLSNLPKIRDSKFYFFICRD